MRLAELEKYAEMMRRHAEKCGNCAGIMRPFANAKCENFDPREEKIFHQF